MRYYSKNAGPKLREMLDQMRSTPDERHSLAEEIDVARVVCLQAVDLFDKTCLSGNAKVTEGSKQLAAELVQKALSHVGDLVTKAAKVKAVHEATFDVELLESMIAQMTKIIEQRVPRELADLVIADMGNMQLPERKSKDGAGKASAEEVLKALNEIEEKG